MYFCLPFFRAVAQPGSALRSGRRGRWFESSLPDLPSGYLIELKGRFVRTAPLIFLFMYH
jgi:hypothetical protein